MYLIFFAMLAMLAYIPLFTKSKSVWLIPLGVMGGVSCFILAIVPMFEDIGLYEMGSQTINEIVINGSTGAPITNTTKTIKTDNTMLLLKLTESYHYQLWGGLHMVFGFVNLVRVFKLQTELALQRAQKPDDGNGA